MKIETVPITLSVNPSTPFVNLASSAIGGNGSSAAASANVTFNIFFTSIQEVTSSGYIVVAVDLSTTNFNLTMTTTNSTNNQTIPLYQYTAILPNNATIQIIFSQYLTATSVEFANQTVNVPANGLKYAMIISEWPFASYGNKLLVEVASSASSPEGNACQSIQSQQDLSESLQWLKVTLNGVALYATFDPVALIDGTVESVQFSFNASSNNTGVTVPHFWTSVEFDPNFQILVDPSDTTKECGVTVVNDHGINTVVVGAVVGSVAGAVVIVGSGVYLQRKYRLKNNRHSLRNTLKKAKQIQDSRPIELEDSKGKDSSSTY